MIVYKEVEIDKSTIYDCVITIVLTEFEKFSVVCYRLLSVFVNGVVKVKYSM